jgi:hypothetical protein
MQCSSVWYYESIVHMKLLVSMPLHIMFFRCIHFVCSLLWYSQSLRVHFGSTCYIHKEATVYTAGFISYALECYMKLTCAECMFTSLIAVSAFCFVFCFNTQQLWQGLDVMSQFLYAVVRQDDNSHTSCNV